MPGPQNPAVASTVLPPISGAAIVDQSGHLTPAGLNLFQQIWAGVFGTGGVAVQYPQPGDLKPIGGSGSQPGWFLCDGTAYLQAQYVDLYRAIGTAWGIGGTGTFKVPDLRGKFVLGADSTHILGASGGSFNVTLGQGNIPIYTLPNTLAWAQDSGISDKQGESGASTPVAAVGLVDVFPASNFGDQTIAVTGHITGDVKSGGSGTPVDTTQPFGAVNWLIKY